MISVDGIRPDYIERSETPFLDKLAAEGAFSLEVIPSFPSVTFASHATIATGVGAAKHGVTANTFYDRQTGERYRYAGDQALLEAEPFWTTATRQGVRTLVLDWVKAHNQTGPHVTDYFGPSYTRGLPDEDRVQRIIDTWRADDAELRGGPLRLILAYTESPDTEGHRFGPDESEVERRLTEIDALMADTFREVYALWQNDAGPDDVLYTILLSDHGMARIDFHVDLRKAFVSDSRIRVIGGSTMHHFFFDGIESETEREALIHSTEAALRDIYPLTVHRKRDLPEHWNYQHPYRTGDIVITVPPPYALYRHNGDSVIQESRTTGRFFGAHGYDPEISPEMNTVIFMQRHPEALGGLDLGRIHLLQVHATVAALLGIEPAAGAYPTPFVRP